MDSLQLCCIVPHAPILVPEIGGGELAHVESTVSSFRSLSRELSSLAPETLIVVSPPHLRASGTGTFSVNTEERFQGSFSRFRAPGVAIEAEYDFELIDAIIRDAAGSGITVQGEKASGERDWGLMVPLYYLLTGGASLVSIPVSPSLSYREHFELGKVLRGAATSTGRKVALVASGDLSHRLTPGAPAGYDPGAGEYDRWLVDVIGSGDFSRLFDVDRRLLDLAGEDCLWSACVMAGAVDGLTYESQVLSYEGPFGVGYMVARVVPGAPG
ncbi:MAG: class III extradiol dioxygenase subunit B-like domain-containing protein [Actinomycetota bacterium]